LSDVPGLPLCRATAGAEAPWWWRRADWLYASLGNGTLHDHDGADVRRLPVVLKQLGNLSFDDGSLVVADPYLMGAEPTAITQQLRPAQYDVLVAATQVEAGHERLAAALLVSDLESFDDWQMAHWPGQDPGNLTSENFFGYDVDAGTGCFASQAAAAIAGRVLAEDAGMLKDPLSVALFDGRSAFHAAMAAPEEGAPQLAIFESGWGDGSYATWLGMTGNGEVAVVLTDFALTTDPYAEPLVGEQPSGAVDRAPLWKRLLRRPRADEQGAGTRC
jgi:hypothetical protein